MLWPLRSLSQTTTSSDHESPLGNHRRTHISGFFSNRHPPREQPILSRCLMFSFHDLHSTKTYLEYALRPGPVSIFKKKKQNKKEIKKELAFRLIICKTGYRLSLGSLSSGPFLVYFGLLPSGFLHFIGLQ